MAPYQPNLRKDDDTRHFEDGIADEVCVPGRNAYHGRLLIICGQPLCAPPGGPADVTRDPMLADKKYGAELLQLRKKYATATKVI